MPGGGKPLNEGTGKVTEIAEKRRLQRNEAHMLVQAQKNGKTGGVISCKPGQDGNNHSEGGRGEARR